MARKPKKTKVPGERVPNPRKKRQLSEMIHRLETQLELLRQYSERAFGTMRVEYYGEVATKLRILLVRSRHNTPLLLEIADRLKIPLNVMLQGPPVEPPKGEPGPGDTVTLDRFFDLSAMHIRTSGGLVGISKREMIRAWCEQLGGAHEDWAIDESILNALELPWVVNGIHPAVIELTNCAKMALQYGDHVLDHIAHSEDVLRFFVEDDNDGPTDPDISLAVARGYGWLSEFMRARGNVEGAAQMIQKAMAAFEVQDHKGEMAATYNSMGIIHSTRGDLDSADVLFRRALEINENAGDLEGVANVYGNLGQVAHARGDLDGAERLHQKALELNRKLRRMDGVATNYGNLGVINWERGAVDEAERMYRQALEIDQELARYEGMANQYYNIGELMAARGEMGAAREMLNRARSLFARIGAKHLVAKAEDMIDKLPD